ncbi:hypothetical protein CIK06_14600 [Plantactinospora sp. KBS50]|nr:hypothetical protein CIK06_14600 [Plantactinospora sp. KBS50]
MTPQPPPPYPPAGPRLTSPDPTVLVGDPVTIVGDNYGANERVRLTFAVLPTAAGAAPAVAPAAPGGVGAMAPLADGPDGWEGSGSPDWHDGHDGHDGYCRSNSLPSPITVTANAAGHFVTTVRICRVGSIQVTGTGLTTGSTATLVLTIEPRHHGDPLPVTGSSVGPQLTIGIAAVAVGALLILLTVAARRRRGRGAARLG